MNDGGFSLPEMLMVTAITATLLTVSFVSAADMIRNSRQTAMDRQAEQIFLALSRNLQGLEASGNTALLQRSFDDLTGEYRPVWLIQMKQRDPFAPSKYALYQTDDNRDDPAFGKLKNLLFPTDGLSAALSAGLDNGYWLILFTPGMDFEKPAEKDNGTEYYFARPTVYQIFFAKNEDAGKESFQKLLQYEGASITKESVERVAARYGHQDDGRKFRLNELNGYVGYYGGDSQSPKVLTSTRYDTFQCEIAEIQNAEKLSVRVKCVIPNDAEYTTCPIEFTLKIEGETSGNTAELIKKPLNAATTRSGENFATFVLDESGGANQTVKAKENPANPTTWKNFLQSHGLIPGENLKLTLSASCGVHETESNIIQRVNSLSSSGDASDDNDNGEAIGGNSNGDASDDNGNGGASDDNDNGGASDDNDSGDAIGGNSNGDAIDDNDSGGAIDGDGNGDAIDGNGNGDAIDDNSNGGAIDGNGNGGAIDGNGNGDAIEDNASVNAIDGDDNGDAIDGDESGDAIGGSGGAINGDTIEDSDSGDPPTESAPSGANADEEAIDPDSDEALYGWTPKENPENELPSDWNGW